MYIYIHNNDNYYYIHNVYIICMCIYIYVYYIYIYIYISASPSAGTGEAHRRAAIKQRFLRERCTEAASRAPPAAAPAWAQSEETCAKLFGLYVPNNVPMCFGCFHVLFALRVLPSCADICFVPHRERLSARRPGAKAAGTGSGVRRRAERTNRKKRNTRQEEEGGERGGDEGKKTQHNVACSKSKVEDGLAGQQA